MGIVWFLGYNGSLVPGRLCDVDLDEDSWIVFSFLVLICDIVNALEVLGVVKVRRSRWGGGPSGSPALCGVGSPAGPTPRFPI